MSELLHDLESVLKGKINDENIRIVSEMVDFLKYKEDQAIWAEIDASEKESVSDDEIEELRRIKEEEFSSLDDVMKRLSHQGDEHV